MKFIILFSRFNQVISDGVVSFLSFFFFLSLFGCHLSSHSKKNSINITEATIGCPIPDLRFMKTKSLTTTTETPFITYETTQIFMPDDFTTADLEYDERTIDVALSTETDDHTSNQRQTRYTDYNPYAWNSDG